MSGLDHRISEKTVAITRLREEMEQLDVAIASAKAVYAEKKQVKEKESEELHKQATQCTEKLAIAVSIRNSRKASEKSLAEAVAHLDKLRKCTCIFPSDFGGHSLHSHHAVTGDSQESL